MLSPAILLKLPPTYNVEPEIKRAYTEPIALGFQEVGNPVVVSIAVILFRVHLSTPSVPPGQLPKHEKSPPAMMIKYLFMLINWLKA